MKKINFGFIAFQFAMIVLAVVTGGVAMAVTAMNYGDNADPNAETPLEGAINTVPTDKGGLVQHGQDANASALQEVGLLDNKWLRKVLEHHALKFPFYTAMFTKAQQYKFTGHKEAEYPELGDIKLEARTTAAINTGGSTKTHTLNINGKLAISDAYIFRKNTTIIIPGIKGWDETGATRTNDALMLYVQDNEGSNFVVFAVNGPVNNGETYVPEIPANTLFMAGAAALAEEEVETDPINVIPEMKTAYLQKKGYSVAITDFFNEAVKDVDWEKSRIKQQALDAYKKTYTTTALFGTGRKFYKKNKNGVRICYTQKGILSQIRMAFQLENGEWTKRKLIAVSKMLFTLYPEADAIEVFLGSDQMESLLNIDLGNSVSVVKYEKDKDINAEVATFTSAFGKLIFTHEPALTAHHLEKAAIAIPMQLCTRIYRDNGTTHSVDGKKGETGNVEELVKDYFVQDDCFVCNAMNSMLIGPASLFSGDTSTVGANVELKIVDVKAMPSSPSAGDMVYLMETDGDYTPGVYKYSGTAWEEYVGEIRA